MLKYSIVLQWSEEDEGYIATVPELPGLSAFGENQKAAVKELLVAAKAFIQVLEETGEEIPKPDLLSEHSGQIRLRMPRTLHANLVRIAKREGVSLNTCLVSFLSGRSARSQVLQEIRTLAPKQTIITIVDRGTHTKITEGLFSLHPEETRNNYVSTTRH